MLVALLPLIAVEDAQRDVDGEAHGVVRAVAVVLRSKGGVGCAVGVGEFDVGVCDGYSEVVCVIVGGGRREPFVLGSPIVSEIGGRYDVADDIEVRTGFVVAHERLELNAGLLSAGDGVRFVGFELGELEVEPIVVEPGEVTGFEALVADVELVFEVGRGCRRLVFFAALATTKLVKAWRTERMVCCSWAWYWASVWAVVERALSRRQRRFSPRSNKRETPTL